jgi:hypothetical protein
MLNGVPALMGCDAEGGSGVAVIVLGGEDEAMMHWIVVIPEETILLNDLHISNSSGIEDAGGRLCSGEA